MRIHGELFKALHAGALGEPRELKTGKKDGVNEMQNPPKTP